ncbi:hypothetical protein JQ557_08395 [Bradyrhizobium sp. U87765 SZCCT0131]|uniref:hypothetical protein n=1 Tax=unclassified Bradyrhizobium TaxID=2631580 RepID=UPI001BA7411E|nr:MULTISPECIES: hypothetical protein [unclassified Bradyrhizobium]MBR1218005.1 hypothetical protein [Bradyrhizobium sp. U87765 SZCCT0131]MBR1261049.1 hypothetical protein [Bradyrhizobium sp. U87765 SZCCT0134]MBR1303503.1 hypothetical protein [Bradyrhizobium sp. U87765 SZCCT0110]MBR1319109.1 hypothetical protein [Bradyrhizobium sp. U87765 SZCCT0109]MBR1347434.1 hypothetical protein [Bradyrhizobium sp. U87765 SZCCT0048]
MSEAAASSVTFGRGYQALAQTLCCCDDLNQPHIAVVIAATENLPSVAILMRSGTVTNSIRSQRTRLHACIVFIVTIQTSSK